MFSHHLPKRCEYSVELPSDNEALDLARAQNRVRQLKVSPGVDISVGMPSKRGVDK
jgi:hypothetical protein